jgi:hypothetical protein
MAAPGLRLTLDLPLVPTALRPERLLEVLAQQGQRERLALGRSLDRILAAAVPPLVEHLAQVLPLTDLVRSTLDLDRLMTDVDLDAVAARIDLDSLVARVDLDALLDRLDLPAMIRESSGSLASESVRTVRLQSMGADQAVARAIGRLRARRRPAPGAELPGGATP